MPAKQRGDLTDRARLCADMKSAYASVRASARETLYAPRTPSTVSPCGARRNGRQRASRTPFLARRRGPVT
jgi:hypothetical protein